MEANRKTLDNLPNFQIGIFEISLANYSNIPYEN